MALAGSLSEVALGDLIQFYCSSHQTVRLAVSYRDGEAVFFIDEGELVHAAFGRHRGIAAVYAAMAHVAEGSFQVENNVRQGERTITDSWKVVCLELASMVEEARRQTPTMQTGEKAAEHAAPPAQPPAAAGPARPTGGATGPPPPGTSARPTATPAAPVRPSGSAAPQAAAVARPAAASAGPPRAPRGSLLVWFALGVGAVVLAAAAYFTLRPPAAPPAPPPKAAAPAPVTLGMSTALTGPSKELGRQMKLGVETALGLVNDAGGIDGRRFSLVALDDGYEPARTKDAMRDLVETRKVFAVVGNVGTPTAEVSVPYVLEKKVLFFGPFTGAGLLRREPPDRYVFNYRASYVEETAAVVRYLVEVRKIKPTQIAVFAQQDGYGDAGFGGVVRALRRYGRDQDQILRVGYKRNTLDISEALDTIVKNQKQIRAIVMVPTYRPAARMIEKVRDLGLDVIFTNVSFVGSSALAEELRQLGSKYCGGVIVTQVVPPTDSSATAIIKYREALQHYFPGESPDFVSLEGYITTNVLMEGFRRAGRNATTESLIDALEGIRGLDMGIGTLVSYGPSEHQGSHKVWGTVLNDACRFQLLDLE
jgi:ABC-type branched-subunit amino acid transport system substrate-binding protein